MVKDNLKMCQQVGTMGSNSFCFVFQSLRVFTNYLFYAKYEEIKINQIIFEFWVRMTCNAHKEIISLDCDRQLACVSNQLHPLAFPARHTSIIQLDGVINQIDNCIENLYTLAKTCTRTSNRGIADSCVKQYYVNTKVYLRISLSRFEFQIGHSN